jgi:hypothetical protein
LFEVPIGASLHPCQRAEDGDENSICPSCLNTDGKDAKAFRMRDEPAVMASPIVAMTMRIVVIACLAARILGVHIRTNQLSHKFGKPFVLSLRPAVRDGSIRALD